MVATYMRERLSHICLRRFLPRLHIKTRILSFTLRTSKTYKTNFEFNDDLRNKYCIRNQILFCLQECYLD